MLYLRGDMHADPTQLLYNIQNNISSNSTIIILGDFGLPWNDTYYKTDLQTLAQLNTALQEHNLHLIALRGNHDNPDLQRIFPAHDNFTITDQDIWYCSEGYFHNPYPNIHLITDPVILTNRINGTNTTFLCLPGAESHDKELRTENVNWWANEKLDTIAADNLLSKYGNFNYILSHDYPGFLNSSYARPGYRFRLASTPSQEYLDTLTTKLTFDSWFHGHLHLSHQTPVPRNPSKLIIGLAPDEQQSPFTN